MTTVLLALLCQLPPPVVQTIEFGGYKIEFTIKVLAVPAPAPIPVPTPAPQPTPDLKRPLQQSDFTYVGRFQVGGLGAVGDVGWGQSFTMRRVAPDPRLRLLTFGFQGNVAGIRQYSLNEFYVPTDFNTNEFCMRAWLDIWPGVAGYNYNGWWHGIWWDAEKQKLWSTSAIDYTVHDQSDTLYLRTLNDDGTVSNLRGPFGFEGLGRTKTFGGAARVPEYLRTKYGWPKYAVGWGGYTSLMGAGFRPSLGPAAYAIPDPETYPDGTVIRAAAFKTLIDHQSGNTETDWYAQPKPTAFDRGVRNSDVINYFDGGDDRPNGQGPGTNQSMPIKAPLSGAQWLSPAPDGLGRWVWGDSNWNTGNFIDLPTKHGLVTVATLGSGKVWYSASAFGIERRTFEIQVFDPNELNEVATGVRKPWDVKPTRWQIELPGRGEGWSGPWRGAAGAHYDPVERRLYVYSPFTVSYVYVWQVSP